MRFIGPLVLLLIGCNTTSNLGSNDAGRTMSVRLDECGNGLDDDGNGAIDDGCPCAPGEMQRCFSGALSSNEVGACSSGTQTCEVVSGSEWGDWGLSDCVGEVVARTEACDGSDADCDGAVDEGCPCTDGMERPCGDEFLLAPCMAGTQSCRGGTWSSCEGAIGPTADVCEDTLDNDCDGMTNEGCDCAYPPVPERCRDGVDNDCDGTTDEPECTPDWPGDAGVPTDAGTTTDAGMSCGDFSGPSCTPSRTLLTTRLNTTQSVYDIESWGCEIAVAHADARVPELQIIVDRLDTSGAVLSSTPVFFSDRLDGPTMALAHGPDGWAVMFGHRISGPPYHMEHYLALLDSAGAMVGTPILLGTSTYAFLLSEQLFWDGARWVAIWSDQDDARNYLSHVAIVDPGTRTFTRTDGAFSGWPHLDGAVWTGTEFVLPMTSNAAPDLGRLSFEVYDASFRLLRTVPSDVYARSVVLGRGPSDWYLAWAPASSGTPSPVQLLHLDGALLPAGAPETVFPDVGYPTNTLSISYDGASLGVGAAASSIGHLRFGDPAPLAPPLDLTSLGASAYTAGALLVAAPRRAVAHHGDGFQLEVFMLCEP